MKLPSISFYPGDWLRDPIAGCSLAAQGLWLRMMMLMHDSERYGYLVMNGSPIPSEQIARRCGTDSLTQYETLLAELDSVGVPSRTESGIIFSRRMVRDEQKRKANRTRQMRFRNADSNAPPNVPLTGKRCPLTEGENEDEGLKKVREFSRGEGISDTDSDWFFWKCQGNGWTNAGKPILDWKATLRCWFRAGFLPSQKQGRNGQRHFSYRNGPEETPDQRKDRITRASQQRQENEAAETQQTDEIQRQKVLVLAKTEIEKLRDQFKMP